MNQEKYFELQILNSEIEQLQQQMQRAERQILDLKKLEDTLTDLSKTEPGTESLAALGQGIFVKTKIETAKEVVMAVGANVSVTKTVEDAKRVIADQVTDTQKALTEIEQAINHRFIKLQRMQHEMHSEEHICGEDCKNHINQETTL